MTSNRRSKRGLCVLAITICSVVVLPFTNGSAAFAQTTTTTTTTTASTCSGNLSGEGGSAFQPVIERLLQDDTSALSPLCPSYTNVNLDNGIADFVGTAPNQFANDFALSERPLTSTEAGTASTDGRSFAYVPIAATPVAIVTLVPTEAWGENATGSETIDSSDFCNGIPLTITDLGDIFGYDAAQPLQHWNDSRIQCPGSSKGADGIEVLIWANNDPTLENESLMALLDSTPASKAAFDAGLNYGEFEPVPGVTDTPSENWPYAQNTVVGGDDPLITKLIALSATTNAPQADGDEWTLGAAAPISNVWTGAPLGAVWDLPTAAIQNAQGSFVAPSEASAAAAEADASLASTSSSMTNNLVTFNASMTDAAAYDNYLMLEEYLVVPTSGLDPTTATKLAQFIRFALGTTGQKDISQFGAAPATAAMVTAGLKVASEVEAQSGGSSSATTTTSPGGSSGTSSSTGSSGSSSPSSSSSSGGSGSSDDGSGSGSAVTAGSSALAFTGMNPIPLLVLGAVLIAVAEPYRRISKRRRRIRL